MSHKYKDYESDIMAQVFVLSSWEEVIKACVEVRDQLVGTVSTM